MHVSCVSYGLPEARLWISFLELQSCRVAKLFAKHFKVEEQQQVLAGQHVNIATGTPNRLCKLVDLGSLKLNRVQLVILDAGKDAKQRWVFRLQLKKKINSKMFHCPSSVLSDDGCQIAMPIFAFAGKMQEKGLSADCFLCRTLLDIPEVCKDLWQFLGRHVKPRLASGSANLALIDWKKLRP